MSGKALIDHEEIAFDKTRGMDRVILTSKVPLHDEHGNLTGVVGMGFDITERKAAEERMASSDRLESIGRLAAGVAHEINTPIQYLNDSVSFIREGVQELLDYIDKLHAAMPPKTEDGEDIDYLREELPPAMTRVADGLTRIAEIVRSMKHFSHADQREMSQVDLNAAIASTLVIARSEYRDVADVETDFGAIPGVTCHGGQINQVVLNLIVNSAHAIADLVKKSGGRGKISVKTAVDGDYVLIAITDTGGGIPENVRAHIFDPFFTTKEVGRGTGQGLSISRNVIVKGHGGKLDFETESGVGHHFRGAVTGSQIAGDGWRVLPVVVFAVAIANRRRVQLRQRRVIEAADIHAHDFLVFGTAAAPKRPHSAGLAEVMLVLHRIEQVLA